MYESGRKVNMKKYFVLFNLIICIFIMTACGDAGLRKSPYTADEMELYLKEKYQKEFVVLSRTECNGCIYVRLNC